MTTPAVQRCKNQSKRCSRRPRDGSRRRPQVPPRSSSIDEYYYSGMVGLVGFSNVYYATALNSAAAAGDDDATDGGGYFAAIETSGCGSSDDGPHDMQGNPFMHTWSLDVEEQYRCRAAHRVLRTDDAGSL